MPIMPLPVRVEDIDPYIFGIIHRLKSGDSVKLDIEDFDSAVHREVVFEKKGMYVSKVRRHVSLACFATLDGENNFYWIPNRKRFNGMIPLDIRLRFLKGRFRRIRALLNPDRALLEW